MARLLRVPAAGVCGALTLSAGLARAQGPVMFEVFGARTEAKSAPAFGGLALGAYSGPFGLRVSGALHTARTTSDVQGYDGYGCRRYDCGGSFGSRNGSSTSIGAWTADADLVFEPLRTFGVGRALLLGFSPYAFGGIGYAAVHPVVGRDTGSTNFNYGLGVRHQLLGWLGVTGEARIHRALNRDSGGLDLQRHNAQYRVGVTVSFGRRSRSAAPAPSVAGSPVNGAGDASAAPITPRASMATTSTRIVPRVLDRADGYVNTPFRVGGAAPAEGFDAGGFVQYVFGREGVELPRAVRLLAQSGMIIATRGGDYRPGDLLFFANDGVTPDHVAIYAGRDRIIHATASGGAVRYDVLGEGARGAWFAAHLVAARRVVDAGPTPERPHTDGDAAPPVAEVSSQPDHAPQPAGGEAR